MSAKMILYFLLISYVILGITISILLKYIYNQTTDNGIAFHHNSFISLLMFISEIFALPVYYIKNRKLEKETIKEGDEENSENKLLIQANKKKEISNIKLMLLIIMASFFDFCACFLSDLAMAFAHTTFVMFLKALILVVFIVFLSWWIYSKKPILDHLYGSIVAFIAIILICLSVFYGKINNDEDNDKLLFQYSLIFVFFAMASQSVQSLIIEEDIIRKHNIHQFFVIGYEGLFGFVINFILCIIFYFIKCENTNNNSKNICNEDDEHIWRMENALFALKQVVGNTALIYLFFTLIIARSLYNLIAISIIKYGGALTRGIIENVRNIFVWVILLIPWTKDALTEKFNWLRFLGVLSIIITILLYFSVFKIDERKKIRDKINNLSSLNERITKDSNYEEGLLTKSISSSELEDT